MDTGIFLGTHTNRIFYTLNDKWHKELQKLCQNVVFCFVPKHLLQRLQFQYEKQNKTKQTKNLLIEINYRKAN